ncbi:Response regulator receiver domain-containing protein [Tenacibaculum sp. MAR_2010_89]|uniref:response regulator n=1 Tax=Tenacibaculum sp. MAR_2010_89 TaxID=1250198 RepID=UPI000899D8A2|nr:response regulator [Tenacibaculum sp. MAR_2010_89]SEE59115.1 Response regulator receiver domain-containing protein [Tenacibaculum sp. MAR_2010_89]
MNIEIVIIDDSIKINDDPLKWELEDKFGEKNVHFFTSSIDGLKYINDSLLKNIIVLLDIQFPKGEKDGHQILEEISSISKLIPVILWSGVDENDEHFSDFINNHAFGFLTKGVSIAEAMPMIDRAVISIETSVDNAIEDWIVNNEEDKDKTIYITSEGDKLSLNDILKEIRLQSNIGKEFSLKLNKLTINLLLRNKEKLDD